MPFRTLEVYALPGANWRYKTRTLDQVLEEANNIGGYHAFYFDPSLPDRRLTTSASNLRDRLLLEANRENDFVDIFTMSENGVIPDECLEAKKVYLLGSQLPENYARTISHFLRKIRADSTVSSQPFKAAPAYAFSQASVYDLVGDREKSSVNIANSLGYHEYFLWDDNQLWTQDDWNQALSNLGTHGFDNIQSEQRLAWLGSGAISLQLSHLCETDPQNPWPYPSALAQILDAAVAKLERFDQALLDYYRETENREPPTYLNSDYVRLLCNFLPDHRSRLKPEKFLSSNSMGDFGGPRAWQGVTDWHMDMKLMHLLLDGLLTLWPKTPEQEAGVGTELVLQPANLALLYWASRSADMPWTKTPEEFLTNYQWDDPNWFGGRRKFWLGNEWRQEHD